VIQAKVVILKDHKYKIIVIFFLSVKDKFIPFIVDEGDLTTYWNILQNLYEIKNIVKTLSFMNKLHIPMMEEGKIMVNVRNSCTPFHMKICNSQNSFGGGIIM
jgi:hypothetical protein